MLTPNTLGKEVNICSSDPEERRDGITLLKQGIDAAEMIEAPQMLVTADHPGYFREREKIWSVLVESMAEICYYACGKGVRGVMEPVTPMESPVVTTSQDCSRLIRDVNSPALYAMLDIVPPVVVHEPFSQYFELLGDRLSYIHICNTAGVTDEHIRLETGVYPIPDVINVFKHHRYEGYVTTELYSENYRDPELLLANTARVLRGIREEIKV
jgi:protein FrlC